MNEWGIYPPLGQAGPVALVAGEENARLIAAAPELLAACKALIAHDKNGRFGEPDFPAAINMARAAVAKAEGRAL